MHNINGQPTIIFSDEETQSLAAKFRFALVGKVSRGSPPYSQLHRLLVNSGLQGAFTVSLINNKHTLIALTTESDYNRLCYADLVPQWLPMRVFKWSPTFTPDQESSIVPVWVNFPELPAHLFHKDAIFSIASIVGTPLQMADSTYNQSKLSRARVCIEIDLLKPLLEEFDIQIQDRKIVQKIEYEQIPRYCSLCKHVRHHDLECYTKGNATKPLPRKRIDGKNKSAVVNEHKQQQKMQGKKVLQANRKVIDERAVRKEPTVVERGECSKTGRSVTGGELPVVVVETENDVAIDAETEDQLHIAHEKEADNLLLVSTVTVETEKAVGMDETGSHVGENDSIRVIENVVELDGNGDDRNDTLDGETIDVVCGGGPVPTKGMEIQLFYQAIQPIIPDRKGKSLKQMKTEEVCRADGLVGFGLEMVKGGAEWLSFWVASLVAVTAKWTAENSCGLLKLVLKLLDRIANGLGL
ncbi:hypothetical protein Sango_2908800 [Sesamum angolense]|uniref:DUF4283 domain-containing protein n=1 Tax=Sesamum angolense TaxID=2727404 RepID=A0AAE1T5W3_9LAMI|nr:hypothetical protein Sango_2908800 [Sesamum angolense]